MVSVHIGNICIDLYVFMYMDTCTYMYLYIYACQETYS